MAGISAQRRADPSGNWRPRPPPNSSSYVCSLLGARLASRGSLLEAESSTVHAALLLTDIQGFTSRVERLCSAGPEGLDELAQSLNSYFVELAETVYGHGGDVLTVTGDAFLCCWLADDPGELEVPTARAAQAALAFQEGAERRALRWGAAPDQDRDLRGRARGRVRGRGERALGAAARWRPARRGVRRRARCARRRRRAGAIGVGARGGHRRGRRARRRRRPRTAHRAGRPQPVAAPRRPRPRHRPSAAPTRAPPNLQ
jgi:hypothetical protein